MIEPMHNNVVLKEIELEQKMYGNILIADLGKEKPQTAEVVAVGPGTYTVTGDHFIKTTLTPGEKVLFPSFGGHKVTFEGEEYIIVKENDIIAKITE